MDYPEPLSSMLRNFDWDGYIASQEPIPVNSVQEYNPYLVVKNASGCFGSRCAPNASTKVIGFISSVSARLLTAREKQIKSKIKYSSERNYFTFEFHC